MPGNQDNCKKLLVDEQILRKINNKFDGSQKANYLTAGVFVITFLALTLIVAVPTEFRKMALVWASAHWFANLIWTIVAGFGWRTISDQDSERLAEAKRDRRLQTIWFHFWKGGFLFLVSTLMLLLGLGLLKHIGSKGWIDILAVGVYGLIYVLAFWRRQRICYVRLVGWSPDTKWGRLMLRLGIIGPAVTASTCSTITIALARLQIIPKSVAAAFFGALGVIVASMVVPQVIYDFLVTWVHSRIRCQGKLIIEETK